jgi:ElaB/YqjD/DUF883 family membrane-anchored ribosome-binding protein
MASATEADVKALHEQLEQLRTDFAGLSGTLKDLARHGIGDAAQRVSVPAEKVWDDVKRRAEAVTHEIEEKPLASAVTAFGIGLVLGILFSGRR